jgi:L-serine dehydratase
MSYNAEETKMAKIFYPDFFNDVFGPIMQPGSSGSFAGTSRVGRMARYTLKSKPKRVRISFNPSAEHLKSLGNMMDDRAYLGGLLDFATDDIRLFRGHEEARAAGLSYEFTENEKDNPYPGSTTFELTGEAGDTAKLVAASIGGGMVRTYEINGFPLEWQADTWAVLLYGNENAVYEAEQRIKENYQEVVYEQHTQKDGAIAALIEYAEKPELSEESGKGVEIRILPALLPVVSRKDRKPQVFSTVEEWRKVAEEKGISFVQAAIEYEKGFSGWSDEEIWNYFEKINAILYNQVHSLEKVGYESISHRFFDGMRHEVLNEKNSMNVYKDIAKTLFSWIDRIHEQEAQAMMSAPQQEAQPAHEPIAMPEDVFEALEETTEQVPVPTSAESVMEEKKQAAADAQAQVMQLLESVSPTSSDEN